MNYYAARPMLNRFVVDSENTVREMVELAVTNWLGSQRFGTNIAIAKSGQFSRSGFSAKEMEECWTIASMCAALIANSNRSRPTPGERSIPSDGPIQHQHTVATCSSY
jgi:hypothetical protein